MIPRYVKCTHANGSYREEFTINKIYKLDKEVTDNIYVFSNIDKSRRIYKGLNFSVENNKEDWAGFIEATEEEYNISNNITTNKEIMINLIFDMV